MKQKRKPKKVDIGNIISAIVFAVILIGIVAYAFLYDKNAQLNSSFFDDVARSIKWK